MRGDATCWSHESHGDLQSAAAADADDTVVCTTASPAFLHATRDARTRVPRLPHMSPMPTCELMPRRAHVDALLFACSKNVQSVGRVGRVERKRR